MATHGTYLDLVNKVSWNLDRTDLSGTSLASLNSSKIGTWINEVRIAVATQHNFNFYYTEANLDTVVGSAYYPLPCDYLDHLSIFCGDTKLSRYKERNFNEGLSSSQSGSIVSNTASGQPVFYALRGTDFQVYPTPNDVFELTIHYYRIPVAFVSQDDYDAVSIPYANVLVYGATRTGALYLEDKYNEQRFEQLYARELNKMVAREKGKEHADAHYRMKTYKDYNLTQFANFMRSN